MATSLARVLEVLRQRRRRSRRDGSGLAGCIESLVGTRLSGWAADRDVLSQPQSVDVYIDGKLVRKAMADRASAMADVETGDALHGFGVDLPIRVFGGGRHSITALISGTAIALDPMPEHRAPALVGTEFTPGRDRGQTGPYALEGTDGWGFLVEDGNGNLDQLLGDLTLTSTDVHRYLALISKRQRRLADIGIPYLFAVAPSKESIHPEYLPDCSPGLGPPVLGTQLIDAARNAGLPVVDLHEPLRERAAAGERLYYKRDTHWTYETGAWSAATRLLEAVRDAGVPAPRIDASEIVWADDPSERDLLDKLRVRFDDGRLYPIDEEHPPERERSKIPNRVAYRLLSVPTPPPIEASSSRSAGVLVSERRPDAPRALVFRDSFGTQLLPYVSLAFSWSAWLWSASVDLRLVESLSPDVVIQVIAERFLAVVPNDDVW